MTESADERPPDLWPDPIPNGHPNVVYLVTNALVWEENKDEKQTSMHSKQSTANSGAESGVRWVTIFATVANSLNTFYVGYFFYKDQDVENVLQ